MHRSALYVCLACPTLSLYAPDTAMHAHYAPDTAMYAHYAPDTAMYAHYVFGTMDHDGTGQITFGDFITGLSVLLKGSLAERVTWIFK